MATRNAGSASITIRPDATSFARDLNTKLRTIADPGFEITVGADFGQARADIARFRQQEGRKGIGIGVDVGLGQAQADLAAFRARQRADGMVIKVDADTGGARRELKEIDKHLESFRRSDLLRLNVGAGLLAGIGPALTGLAQVAAAIQQIAQAGLALPGVFAGAASSIGTLVVGLSGIKDAYDAVSTAASSAGQDQTAAARASTAASNQLRNANVDLGRAYEDVARATRDARQELTDLRVEQRGGLIDESRAILEAQKAREDLLSGNYSDIRDATLRVAEADQRLIEVRNRNAQTADKLNEANQKGIAGNDAVVAANERVVRSQQQVTDAQNAAADSGAKMSAAQKKADETMAKLGPNAQAVVRTLVELTPEFEKVQQAISQPLLEGKAEEFKNFFTTMRPVVEQGGADIARGWNQNITALFDSLGSEQGKGLIDRILGNTGDAQARLSKAMDPLVKGVGTLVAAGTDALPRLADGLTGALERFRDFIEEADRDGSLEKWINDGIDGLASVGESVLNIGKSFTAITSAAGGGGSFLSWLESATGRLQTFLNSAEGQEQLKKFFQESSDFYHQTLRPVLEDIPGLLKGIHDGAVTYIGGLMTTISPLTDFLRDHPGLVEGAVAAYAAWKTIDGVTSLMDNLKSINTMLGVTLPDSASKGASKMTAALGPVAALAAAIIAVDPERHLTGDKSIKEAADQGDWGRVLFGDGWDWIKGRLNIGEDVGQAAAAPSGLPSPGAPPSTGTPAAQAQAPAGTRESGGVPAPTINGLPAGQATAPAGTRESGGLPPGIVPPKKEGGPTPSGRGPGPTGGWLAEIHSNEWVLPAHARSRIGDAALWSLTQGRSFQPGGYIDEHGNPVTPGPAPGPAAPPIVAANPTGNSGGISGIFGRIASGIQGPINNVTSMMGMLGQASPGGTAHGTVHGASAGAAPGPAVPGVGIPSAVPSPVATFGQNLLGGIVPGLNIGGGGGGAGGGGQQLLPGFAGLFQAGGNQGLQQQWLSQTGDWLANWGASTLLDFGSTLLNGVLGFFGAEGLMQNPLIQGIGQTVGHFGGLGGQLGGVQAPSAGAPAGLAPGTVLGTGGGTITLLDESGTPTTLDLASLPSRGGEEKLQVNSVKVKRAIEALFPQISGIGGYREDAKPDHPGGVGLDIPIPGWDTPEGKALGDRINQYLRGNASTLGVDSTIWQDVWSDLQGNSSPEPGHMNHIHVRTTGGGYGELSSLLAGATGGGTPTAPAGSGVERWRGTFANVLNRLGLPQEPWLSLGMQQMQTESGGDPTIFNNWDSNAAKGTPSGGLMQVIQPTFDAHLPPGFIADLTNPESNIAASIMYTLNRYGGPQGVWGQGHGYAAGGPTPPGRKKAYPALLHGDEYVISARGRAQVSDEFLHKLNIGEISQDMLPQFAYGGPTAAQIQAAYRVPTPPTPPPVAARPIVPDAKTKVPAPAPTKQAPAPVADPRQPTTAPPPVAQQAPPSAAPTGPAPAGGAPRAGIVAPPNGIDHTLPWINQAIDSGAQAIGQALSTAMGLGGGAAGGFGGAALGALGPYAAGAVMQGGKVVKKVANVISSSLVGSVPGSFGGEVGARAYGKSLVPEQAWPDGSMSAGGGARNYTFNGISDVNRLMDRLELADRVSFQSEMANHRK